MACKKHCDPTTTQIIHGGGASLTVLESDGSYVTRGTAEKAIDYKSDGRGDVYTAGTGEVMEEFSVSVGCTDEAAAIYTLFTSTKLPLCSPGSIVTDCCGNSVFKTLILTGAKAPDVANDVQYYEFNYRGYYLQAA